MSRFFRLSSAATLVTAALTLALAACGTAQNTGAAPSGSTPVSGGILRVNYWPDNVAFPCIDPFQTYWLESRQIIRNLADSLTDQDSKTGKIVPWLAKSWTISPDALTYTFSLRTDVTFSDGTKLDASAVKANFDGFQATLKTLPSAYGAVYITGLESTTVTDPSTVVFKLSKPNAAFLQATSTTNLAILAPSAFTQTPADRCLGKGLVASGPFTLKSYTSNKLTEITKRTGYRWGSSLNANTGDAYLDGIQFSYVAEDSVRTGNLVSGASDVAWPRNPFTEEDRNLITKSGLQLSSRSLPGPASNFYVNNTDGHALSDLKVRQAVTKAIDRATYAATVFGKDYPVASSVYNTTTPFYVDHSKDLAFDKAGAEKLLDAAGWAKGSDGYRAKDGKRLTIVYPITAKGPGPELLQAELKDVGIELTLTVYQAADRTKILSEGKYDLIDTYFTRGDPGVLQWILDAKVAGSVALAKNTQTTEQAAKVTELFTAGVTGADDASRAKTYADLQQYLLDQVITIPVFERVQYAGLGKSVRGFQFTSESFGNYYNAWLAK